MVLFTFHKKIDSKKSLLNPPRNNIEKRHCQQGNYYDNIAAKSGCIIVQLVIRRRALPHI